MAAVVYHAPTCQTTNVSPLLLLSLLPLLLLRRYAFCKKTSQPLAIKTYKKRKLSPLNRCQVAREIHIHAQLDHPNIIALVSAQGGEHTTAWHSTAQHSMLCNSIAGPPKQHRLGKCTGWRAHHSMAQHGAA
jgi:hypothetical protein